MAFDGYIIGISIDTSASPKSFWSGVGAAQTEDIDNAYFVATLRTARIDAGNLQIQLPDNHVEVYPATKSIVYQEDPGTNGI